MLRFQDPGRRSVWPRAALLASALLTTPAAGDPAIPHHTRTVETGPMAIDRIYRSMTGPYEQVEIDMSGIDWVTAIRTEVVEDGDRTPMGGEFFCHSQLQLGSGIRLTVNATGTEEIELPRGFGVPAAEILAGLPSGTRAVSFLGMVLNNNFPIIDQTARIRAVIEYMTNDDLPSTLAPPRRLYPIHVAMQVGDAAVYHPAPGEPQPHADVATHCALVEGQPTHWLVPPGPQRTRRRLTGLVPVEATVHHISAHVHNHGEYVRLTDVTTGEILWQADVEYERDRRQIRSIPVYSSPVGLPVFPDHEYEIEAYYDNRSDAVVDAMAVLYLYFNPRGNARLDPSR